MKNILQFLQDNWQSGLMISATLWEIIVRLKPSEKTISLLTLVWRILNAILPDKNKMGGTHIVLLLLLLVPFVSRSQNDQTVKAVYSVNASDSARIIAAASQLNSKYGPIGGLYYNKTQQKWRIFLGVCPDTSFHNGCWVDLPVSQSASVTADNGLTKTGNNIQLRGNLIRNTNINQNGHDFKINGQGGALFTKWDWSKGDIIITDDTTSMNTNHINVTNIAYGNTDSLAGSVSYNMVAGSFNKIDGGPAGSFSNLVFGVSNSLTQGISNAVTGNFNYAIGSDYHNYSGNYMGGYTGRMYDCHGCATLGSGNITPYRPILVGTSSTVLNSSFNFSGNNSSQTVGHGVLSNYSGIFGGLNHNIPNTAHNSVILGGRGIKVRANDSSAVYVPQINISGTVFDPTKWININGNTIAANNDNLTLTGNNIIGTVSGSGFISLNSANSAASIGTNISMSSGANITSTAGGDISLIGGPLNSTGFKVNTVAISNTAPQLLAFGAASNIPVVINAKNDGNIYLTNTSPVSGIMNVVIGDPTNTTLTQANLLPTGTGSNIDMNISSLGSSSASVLQGASFTTGSYVKVGDAFGLSAQSYAAPMDLFSGHGGAGPNVGTEILLNNTTPILTVRDFVTSPNSSISILPLNAGIGVTKLSTSAPSGFTISSANGISGSAGGQSFSLQGGTAFSTGNNAGGNIFITGGSASNSGAGGSVSIDGGTSPSGTKGSVNIATGGTSTSVLVGLSATTIGLYGVAATAQGSVGTTLVNNVTVGGTTGTIADFTSLSVYATDAATIRNDIYQLALKVQQLEAKLKLLGAVKD